MHYGNANNSHGEMCDHREEAIEREIMSGPETANRSLVMWGVRPRVQGKFIFLGDSKFYVRGVTYGAFRPGPDGREYSDEEVVERDLALMAANGVNCVRIPHTVPPRSLLDAAQQQGIRVMVGLSAEEYVGFLIDKKKSIQDVQQIARAKINACAGHPAILCYAVGNEIPAPIVRWLGRRWVESYIEKLCWTVRDEDPSAIVTYVNYPTTEYLQLPFLDLVCFNVYLESQNRLEAYLARLQNIAGDRPLVISEIGLDSLRHGELAQAQSIEWQIRSVSAAGCAGGFIFAWTDEWYRADADVGDWAFGLTRDDRTPKPALATARKAFAEVPHPLSLPWPSISVIVCSHNGSRTIRDCLEGILDLDYPNYEVIVVDDGSTDGLAAIAGEYGFQVITTENQGLSNARNTGTLAASGEIVAFIDDDARPDPHWLTYLAATFLQTTHVGVGGPNIARPDDGFVANCVARAPGNPVHVLLSDQEAEHLPGCNMAFHKSALEMIGGFDPQFRTAGDDVDVCWRLRERGWTLGFAPGAVVWHRRRDSLRAYWKQQLGYGQAEALLERKWPEKYNAAGHATWRGRLYGIPANRLGSLGGRIYNGTWGTAPFQSLYAPVSNGAWSLTLLPEWYLVLIAMVLLSGLGASWRPLLLTLPLLFFAAASSIVQAALNSSGGCFAKISAPCAVRLRLWSLTTFLHLIQPLARLQGRWSGGLTPWRVRGVSGLSFPKVWTLAYWSERWKAPEEHLRRIEKVLRASGVAWGLGGSFDQWDIEVRGGLLGSARMVMAVEEHPGDAQLARIRLWPKVSSIGVATTVMLGILAILAARDGAWPASTALGAASSLLVWQTYIECAGATAAMLRGVQKASTEGKAE
ncbi:MAG: glycosyltransferase [Chloroflexi bacterium]|nr:glycosyltransferase [Chloroflexota bacterium]